MPNSCGPAMRIFTKLAKVESAIYVDDSHLQGDTYEKFCLNVATNVKFLSSLGYITYADKFQFIDIN